MTTLSAALSARPYPGRGCVAARVGDGSLWVGYFLTGRSEASRSRALEVRPGGDVEVVDTSGAGGGDALRHYLAAVRRGAWTVVGNGDQVEPLATELAGGSEVLAAWSAHTYEPDPPIYTPRIWIAHEATSGRVILGSAHRSERSDGGADRVVWLPETLPVGSGVLVTTYAGTATQVVPSASACDVVVEAASGEELLDELWGALDPSLRVAALVLRPADGALHQLP